MKKTIIGITMVTVLVGAFAFTGTASAMAPEADSGSASFGRGPGNRVAAEDPLYLNHEDMVSALAELTGLDVAEIEARLEAGETAYDIAIAAGVAEEEFYALLPMGAYGFRMENGERVFERFQMQENAGLFMDGDCDEDGIPDQLNLQDGTGAGRGGRWNR